MAADTRPEPLVPADCDCTDLDGFMLNVERLMASELVALSSHEVVAAALFLWCRAWKQRPAASLPNDERVMAAFARLPLTKFRKLRGEVLRGFVECSDGRFYHRVLAEEARRAFDRKAAFRRKRETDADRLRKWRSSQAETQSETPLETGDETQSETRFVAEGQGQGQGQGHIDVVVDEGRAPDRDPDDSPPSRMPFDPDTEAVIEAAGADPSKQAGWMACAVQVAKWRQRGADIALDVLPTIRAVMVSRQGRGPPNGPSYFDRAIVEAIERRQNPLPDATPAGARPDGRTARQRDIDRRRAEQADAFRAASRGELGDVFG